MSSFSKLLFAGLLIFAAVLGLSRCASAQEIVITFGGDTNFAGSRQTPEPDRIRKWKTFSMDEATAALRPEWNGDVNFVNVETVVAAQNGAMQASSSSFARIPTSSAT